MMSNHRISAENKTTRRNFLKAAACGGAALAASSAHVAAGTAVAAAPAWKMRLSTSSIHYTSVPIEKACRRIAALGFEAIDIWAAHRGCPHLDDVVKRLGADGLKAVLAENKLKLFGFSVYTGGYRRYAELLGKCGGGVAVRGSAGAAKPSELTSRMRALLESLKPDAELAERHHSYLAIENHGGALLNDLDSFKAFVDLNRSPRIGIALAPYHLQPIKAPVEKAIETCGDQLFFFYAWQHARGTEQLPGIGPTDFTPWIAALAKIKYQGYVNPFMHGEPEPDAMSKALARSKAYLEKCYAAAV